MKKKIYDRPTTIILKSSVFDKIKKITDRDEIGISDFIRSAIDEKLQKESAEKNKEERTDQLQAVEVSEDSLREVMNDNPNMEGNIEIEPGNYISSQSLIEKYQRIKNELKEKDDYIKVLEDELIEIANNANYRGEAITEMMEHMRECICCHVGKALSFGNNKSGNQT